MDRKSLYSKPTLHRGIGKYFPRWKELVKEVRERGDDSFTTNLSKEMSDRYHGWVTQLLHELGSPRDSYVDSSIALAMKNVAPHTDSNVGGNDQDRIGATFLVVRGRLDMYAASDLSELDNRAIRMEAGDLITFHDEEHLHFVMAERKWLGVAGQVYQDYADS